MIPYLLFFTFRMGWSFGSCSVRIWFQKDISHLDLAFSKVRWKTSGFQTRHPRYQGPSFWDMQVGPVATNIQLKMGSAGCFPCCWKLLHFPGVLLRILVAKFWVSQVSSSSMEAVMPLSGKRNDFKVLDISCQMIHLEKGWLFCSH